MSPKASARDASPPPYVTPADEPAGASRSSPVFVQPHPPAVDDIMAHLKLLETLAQLRRDIYLHDGLFGLWDAEASAADSAIGRHKIKRALREKRWAAYVTMAVQRFEIWWNRAVAADPEDFTLWDDMSAEYVAPEALAALSGKYDRLVWTQASMPPLDVLMVWHTFTLHPRAFLDDCARAKHMQLWYSGLPWATIDRCISDTYEYVVPLEATINFETATQVPWTQDLERPLLSLKCPKCASPVAVPLTTGAVGNPDKPFVDGTGFADRAFTATCDLCQYRLDHNSLAVARFQTDARECYVSNKPMPGTMLGSYGAASATNHSRQQLHLPNRLLQQPMTGAAVLEFVSPSNAVGRTLVDVSGLLGRIVNDRDKVAKITTASRLSNIEAYGLRRMMASYWNNGTAFSTDLVGAVVRQGSFVEKMEELGWIDSPSVAASLSRFRHKYAKFFSIIRVADARSMVPTIDIDLVWHTHQANAFSYYVWSLTALPGVYVDHDDKASEPDLMDAFQATTKAFQSATNGELYSECVCWFCESVREFDASSLLPSKETRNARANTRVLRLEGADRQPCAHMSVHAVLRPNNQQDLIRARMQRKLLERTFKKVRQRAKKGGFEVPEIPEKSQLRMWGLEFLIRNSAAISRDPSISDSCYGHNPLCLATVNDEFTGCAAATCSATVSAGSCQPLTARSSFMALAGGDPMVYAHEIDMGATGGMGAF
ncbi:uncharacterized protein V1510DRAFT_418417 [Dipodascopsis tothii]|uniref:uncharacterized protein n=1 Tax=Dipodascopsis tothii TaxID=44089 RepID=UPI0034CF5CF8